MVECEHFRIGKEYLESVSWPPAFRQRGHDRCYCYRCYRSDRPDTLTVAGYTYVIPRGWTRFAIPVDVSFFDHHNVWNEWLNCYHGTSINNAISCVEHRGLLLPNDTTMYGRKLGIREDHTPSEHYVFTTPSISYAALKYYAGTYTFRSPSNSQFYTIKVVLQCKQKPDSIIVQPETVGAREEGKRLCPYIPNDRLEWKTQHRSSVMIYGLLLEIKQNHVVRQPTAYRSKSAIPRSYPYDIPESYDSSPSISNSFRDSISKKKIVVFIFLVISMFLPLAALVVGQIYKNDCPIQPWIPQWLTIFGLAGLSTFTLIFIILFITSKRYLNDPSVGNVISGCVLCLVLFFFLGWLIAGSVWIYPVKLKVQFNQSNQTNYCHENLYKFAFGLSLAQYALIGILMCCGGCVWFIRSKI